VSFGIDITREAFPGWGTGVVCAGESHLLVDHPHSVITEVFAAEDGQFLQFTAVAGYVDDDRLESANWLPRRPLVLRVDQIDIIEPITPEYIEYHERED
jgi:hypothetical protein